MLIVTHEMHFAREVGDRLIFMDGGKIVEQGIPAEVLDRPQQERTQRFLAALCRWPIHWRSLTSHEEGYGNETTRRHRQWSAWQAWAARDLVGGAVEQGAHGRATREAEASALPANDEVPRLVSRSGSSATRRRSAAGRAWRNAGYDVEIARQFARCAFGKATAGGLVRDHAGTRGTLTSDRVDIVIATFTWTQDRETRIDFSRAYLRRPGPVARPERRAEHYLSDAPGQEDLTTTGSIYDRWMKNCFKDTRVIPWTASRTRCSSSRTARRDAMSMTASSSASQRRTGPSSSRAIRSSAPVGHRDRAGEHEALKRWVDARLTVLKQRDTFERILEENVPAREFARFSGASCARTTRSRTCSATRRLFVRSACVRSVVGAAAQRHSSTPMTIQQ